MMLWYGGEAFKLRGAITSTQLFISPVVAVVLQ